MVRNNLSTFEAVGGVCPGVRPFALQNVGRHSDWVTVHAATRQSSMELLGFLARQVVSDNRRQGGGRTRRHSKILAHQNHPPFPEMVAHAVSLQTSSEKTSQSISDTVPSRNRPRVNPARDGYPSASRLQRSPPPQNPTYTDMAASGIRRQIPARKMSSTAAVSIGWADSSLPNGEFRWSASGR